MAAAARICCAGSPLERLRRRVSTASPTAD